MSEVLSNRAHRERAEVAEIRVAAAVKEIEDLRFTVTGLNSDWNKMLARAEAAEKEAARWMARVIKLEARLEAIRKALGS